MSAKKKKRRGRLMRLAMGLTAVLCALALGLLFYAALVYGTDESRAGEGEALTLSLGEGALLSEETVEEVVGGARCQVLRRRYLLENGTTALALTAEPAAYMQRLAQEGFKPQLVTGFLLAGLDAVYERRDERALLAVRDGDTVFMIEADVAEEAIYALGAGAKLE